MVKVKVTIEVSTTARTGDGKKETEQIKQLLTELVEKLGIKTQ